MITKRTKIAVAISTVVAAAAAATIFTDRYVNQHFPGHSQGLGGLRVAVERIDNDAATAKFKFSHVPAPFKPNAATCGQFSLVSGRPDDSSAWIGHFQSGLLPDAPDAPDRNFFFAERSMGGRLLVDLDQAMGIKQINSYSWHKGDRGPQRYNLYGHDEIKDGTNPSAVGSDDPVSFGWVLLAKVDTRPKTGTFGGQYGVSVSSPNGTIGHYRYLLFDCRRTESVDGWGNTFYSEIDVIAK